MSPLLRSFFLTALLATTGSMAQSLSLQLVGLPGALAPVQLGPNLWNVRANTSVTVLPQHCVYYTTGVALRNASRCQNCDFCYELESVQRNKGLVFDHVLYRNSSVANASEIVLVLCSTFLNAPVILRSEGLAQVSLCPNTTTNGTVPPVKLVTGPFYTYGPHAVSQLSGNIYMLTAQSNRTVAVGAPAVDYHTGIYQDTSLQPDGTVMYSMSPGTHCMLNSFSLQGPENEIVLNVQASGHTSCTILFGEAMAVAVTS